MDISRITNYLASWVGSAEKQLAGSALNVGCHGLFLLGKAWDGIPSSVTRTVHAYTSVSALLYLDYSFRILADRIRTMKLCLTLGNRTVACYAGLEALNCSLSIFLSLGYTLAALTPKETSKIIYRLLKPVGLASITIGIICRLWERRLVTQTSHALSAYSSEAGIELIRTWFHPSQPHPFAAQLVSSLHMEIRQTIHQATVETFETIKKHLDTRSSQVNAGMLQTVIYFGQQYVSKNHPDTLALAITNFIIHFSFFCKECYNYSTIRNQKKLLV